MITRLVCLVFAAAIARVGINEASSALIALAATIVGLSLMGIGDPKPDVACRPKLLARPGRPAFTPRILTRLSLAVSLSAFTVAISGSTSLLAISIPTYLLTAVAVIGLGLALDGLTWRDALGAVRSLFDRRHRLEVASVAAIMVVALALRGYQLETLPAHVHLDEGWHGMTALEFLNGDPFPFFKSAPYTYPFNFVQALFIAAFGRTAASVRAVAVIAGVLCVPIVYGIGRIGWGRLAGATAAWLFTVSALSIHYSRMGHVFIPTTMLTAASMLLLTLAARQARRRAEHPVLATGSLTNPPTGGSGAGVWTLLLAAGAMSGFTLPIYLSARVLPIIAGILLLFMLWRRWIGVWHIAAFGLGLGLVYAPMGAYYLDRPQDLFARQNTVSAFQDWYVQQLFGPTASLPSALPALLAEQTQRTFSLFVNTGDFGGFYSSSVPAFDPVSEALMWLGFGVAVTRIRRFPELSLLTWAAVTLVLGSIFILGARNGHRILHMTPAAFLLGGVLVARVYEIVCLIPFQRARWGVAPMLVAPVVGVLAIWTLWANVTLYFFDFAPRYENADATLIARQMQRDAGRYHVYLLTLPFFPAKHSTIDYLAHGVPAQELRTAADFQPPPDDGQGLLVIAVQQYIGELQVVEARIPGGQEQPIVTPSGRLLLYVYRLPPAG